MFNKEKFAEILLTICNTYDSQQEFADAAEVNRAYLSKYIHKKIASPPSPKIIKKIVSASKGITTYEELMNLCNYLDEKDNVYPNISYSKLEQIVMEKVIALENENAQLKNDLATANAKLEIYERLATITNSDVTLGFGPPQNKE